MLGPYDPDAPCDEDIGWSPRAPFGHRILARARFSGYRVFSMTTYANGHPKTLPEQNYIKELPVEQIQSAAKRAVRSCLDELKDM